MSEKRHSILDLPPLDLGETLRPLDPDDDLLSEMLEPRRKRDRFRQRTFAGKPLPDDAVIHANRVASEVEDNSVIATKCAGTSE
jgi:hypothetical protein